MSDDKNLRKDTLFTDEEILDHEYDGIKEMNNGMPFWLSWLFIGSIIWGIIYYLHYESGAGITQQEEFVSEMAELKAKVAANEKQDVDYWATMNNAEGLMLGSEVYKLRCVACHGEFGEGGIGPNLTDAYWIHGDDSVESIAKLIDEGVTEKGMPAWGAVITKKELAAVTYFVESLVGTEPPKQKAPQGKLIQ